MMQKTDFSYIFHRIFPLLDRLFRLGLKMKYREIMKQGDHETPLYSMGLVLASYIAASLKINTSLIKFSQNVFGLGVLPNVLDH